MISASSGAFQGTATLSVTAPALTAISVTPANSSLALGLSQQLIATGIYTDGSTQNLTGSVTWSSSVSGIASINSTGLASSVTRRRNHPGSFRFHSRFYSPDGDRARIGVHGPYTGLPVHSNGKHPAIHRHGHLYRWQHAKRDEFGGLELLSNRFGHHQQRRSGDCDGDWPRYD